MGKKPRNLDHMTLSELAKKPEGAGTILEPKVEIVKEEKAKKEAEGGSPKKKRIKTTAKAYGLKSLMGLDGKVLLTTFGPKEKPIVYEQQIDENGGAITYVLPQADQTFDTSFGKPHQLKLKPLKRSLDKDDGDEEGNLLVTSPIFEDGKLGMDYLGFKPKLEKEMFGEEKPGDNIHIQIAYNVLDLKKIIGFQIGDVIYSLRNIGTKRNDVVENDVVGMVRFEAPCPERFKEPNKTFFKQLQPYSLYYDGVLKYPPRKGKGESEESYAQKEEDSFRHNYNLMRILSALRQACIHPAEYPSLLFSFETDPRCADIAEFAKGIFEKDFQDFVASFASNSQKNLAIFFDVEGLSDAGEQASFASKYLSYLLTKDGKNFGFSLKEIRKMAVDIYLKSRRVGEREKYALLAKLNSIFDYLLYRIYKDRPERVAKMVESLRAAMTEEEKAGIYKAEFDSLVSEETIRGGAYFCRIGDSVASHLEEKVESSGFRFTVNTPQLSVFALFIYVACKFMDGKEVNELTTSIINKFENIGTLVSVLKDDGVNRWKGFVDGYALFQAYTFEKLASQIRLVKNMGSVKRKLKKQNEVTISSALYADAINLFKDDRFVEAGDAEMSRYMDFFFSAEKYQVERKGKKVTKSKPSEGTKVRNFLSNSIINNRRFAYLIKYLDPRKCRKLMRNEALVRFVLEKEDMPLSTLQRYYQAVTEGKTTENRALMVDRLVRELSGISIDGIESMGNSLLFTKDQFDPWLVHQKTVLSLYLTVAYLIVKGMVHVNAFYLIAWSMFERDYFYRFDCDADSVNNLDFLALTKAYLPNKKARVQKDMNVDILEAEGNGKDEFRLYRAYRNKVVHLEVIGFMPELASDIRKPQSYFDIYAYTVQKWALAQDSIGVFEAKLRKDLGTYHSYQRDFLKILNLPFAYNLPRFKNLTIADLFNEKY